MIKGTVNILGWEIYAHVKLSDEVRKTTDLIFQINFCLIQIIDPQKARTSCHTKQFYHFFQIPQWQQCNKEEYWDNIKLDWDIKNMQVVIYKLVHIHGYLFPIDISYLLSVRLTWIVIISM